MPLTGDRNTHTKDGELIGIPVAAGAKIYAGALLATNATGFAVGGSTSATLIYVGCAEEFIDNTAGADGAQTILARRGKLFKFMNSGADPITQADFGKTCYIVDDQTVAKTNGGSTRSAAGKVFGVDADGVWVL